MPLDIHWDNLHQLLRNLQGDMLVQCGSMAVVAKCVAGIGAMLYVGYRVWQSLTRAEPIDVFRCCGPSCWACASCSFRRWCWAPSTEYFGR